MDIARRHRLLGWALLVGSFAAAVLLDPWSLGEHDPHALPGSARMAARHAQAVCLGMAFLQFVLAHALQSTESAPGTQRTVSLLALIGTLIYAGGYALLVVWPAGAWLVPAGALANFLAFALLLGSRRLGPIPWLLWTVLAVFCFGMLLDALMGLFAVGQGGYRPGWLGPEEGLRQRMLRLARAAVIALSTLALLYELQRHEAAQEGRLWRIAGVVLLLGAVGMPLLLTAAALTTVELKYLLGLPAQASFLGTLAGGWLAWKRGPALALVGWVMVAAGMAGGLFMGLYAFDGPLPDPAFLGAYNDYPRRLSRLGHAYVIVFGLTALWLARSGARRAGVAVWSAGAALTVLGLALVWAGLPPGLLGVGPALVAVGLVVAQPGRSA